MPVNLRERPIVHKAAHAAAPRWLLPAAWRAGAALLGLLGARAPLLGGARPLGLCFAVCVPAPLALFAAAGAAAGYGVSLAPEAACPYLVASAGAALLRGFARARRAQETPMASAAASCLIFFLVQCGFAVTEPGGALEGIFSALAGALLTLGLDFMLTAFFALPRPAGGLREPLGAEQRAAACFGYMALLACLTPCAVFALSPAHFAAALAVLLAAYRGGTGASAALGVASMLTLCAASPEEWYAGFAIAVGGLAASLFAEARRGAAALIFCAAALPGLQGAPDGEAAVRLGVELCCAGAAACLLPARLLRRLPAAPQVRLDTAAGTGTPPAAAGTLAGRLSAVSGALCTVGDTMRAVCKHMPPRHESFSDLCDDAAERCCKTCEKRLFCWVNEGGSTRDALCALAARIAAGEEVSPDALPEVLRARCIFPLRLTSALNTAAAAQHARRTARVRTDSVRAALCEQYAATASALTALAGEVFAADLPDRRKAHRLEQLFLQLGLEPMDVSAALNEAGRLTAVVSLPRTDWTDAELTALAEEAAALFHRAFAPVQCEETGTVTRLTFREAPRFRVECAVSAMGARDGVCADAVRTFTDAAGRFVAVLCDGMGTGKRAAVGGALAASLARELLHAGVDSDSAARLVNIALALKGEDENAVTLDVLTVDLYTGEAWVYKAGAAASFVLHGGACEVYSSDTLPIGILEKVSGRRERVQMAEGDTALLVSDGALAPGASWLRAELLAHAEDAPRRLAEHAAHAAWERQKDAPDDVTVVAVRMLARG